MTNRLTDIGVCRKIRRHSLVDTEHQENQWGSNDLHWLEKRVKGSLKSSKPIMELSELSK